MSKKKPLSKLKYINNGSKMLAMLNPSHKPTDYLSEWKKFDAELAVHQHGCYKFFAVINEYINITSSLRRFLIFFALFIITILIFLQNPSAMYIMDCLIYRVNSISDAKFIAVLGLIGASKYISIKIKK